MKYLSNLYDAVDFELILSFKRRGRNREVQSKCGLSMSVPLKLSLAGQRGVEVCFPRRSHFLLFRSSIIKKTFFLADPVRLQTTVLLKQLTIT